MMKWLHNLSLPHKLTLLVGTFVAGLFGFGFYSQSLLDLAKVNGPLYKLIIKDKDLLADVLPPPAFIIESFLVAYQMREAKTPGELNALIDQYSTLKKDYYTRQEVWSQTLAEGEIRDELLETSRRPAEAFFAEMDERLIPSLKQQNLDAVERSFGRSNTEVSRAPHVD